MLGRTPAMGSPVAPLQMWARGALALLVLAPAALTIGVKGDRNAAAAPVPRSYSVAAEHDLARRLGGRVEVVSQRSSRGLVFANPDGTTTVEQHAVPVNVQGADGSWAPIDTGLVAGVDGRLAPRVTAVALSFSAGGDRALVRIGTAQGTLSLTAPWTLPAPAVDGPRASYMDVLPGVDLVLTARSDGFSEVLVVKTRMAAAHAALDAIAFGLTADRLRVREHAGGFVALDDAGGPVLASPRPMMWDSAGDVPTDMPRVPDWPLDGDRRAPMGSTVTDAALTVRPDRAMLDDPATEYPVYLDPSVTATRHEWAMISSGFPDEEYYKFAPDEGMGLCEVQTVGACARDQVKRLAWEFLFPTAAHGKHILSATFRAWETSAYDCNPRAVQLWRVGAVSTATTWRNHAGLWPQLLHTVNIAHKPGCVNGPDWVEFNATTGAVDAARLGWGDLTLGLRAGNEGSMPGGWKRFRSDATLSITYNSVPLVPDLLGTHTSPGSAALSCASGAARPSVGSLTPTFRARMRDADTETDLSGTFEWQRLAGSAWQAVGSASQSGRSSNTTAEVKVPAGQLADGGVYRWRVRTSDPWSVSSPPMSGTDVSPWSGWCEFAVDQSPPTVAPGVSSPVYQQDGEFHGSVGLTADFTFAPSGVDDVTGYLWGWADPPTQLAAVPAPGASLTMPITPPPPDPANPTFGGQATLYVRSVDAAGSPSPVTAYSFLIGSATAPTGEWALADPAGSPTLADGSGNGRGLTLTSGTAGAVGRLLPGPGQDAPTSVAFNGSTTVAATSAPVLDTGKSFTVSAWVRLAGKTHQHAVLSQDGSRVSGFSLHWAPTDRWVFERYGADADNPAITRVASATAPRVDAWTHLTAVYDAGAGQIVLYVDGTLAGTADYRATWNAAGSLVVGRARFNGVANNHLHGQVSDARAWDRVLSAAEVAPMAATQVGWWNLDGATFDDTIWGRDTTASGGVTWAPGRTGEAALFDGVSGRLGTTGPAVRTDQSFTVAARVRLTAKGTNRTVVAQAGNGGWAALVLTYQAATDRWALSIPRTDETSPNWQRVFSTAAPQLNTWTDLVAVYDAASQTARLYVDGQLQDTRTGVAAWSGAGPFQIGAVTGGLNTGNHFAGAIDDVRLFAGALPASEITTLYQG